MLQCGGHQHTTLAAARLQHCSGQQLADSNAIVPIAAPHFSLPLPVGRSQWLALFDHPPVAQLITTTAPVGGTGADGDHRSARQCNHFTRRSTRCVSTVRATSPRPIVQRPSRAPGRHRVKKAPMWRPLDSIESENRPVAVALDSGRQTA